MIRSMHLGWHLLVSNVMLRRKQISKMTVKYGSFYTKTTKGIKNKGSKRCKLYIQSKFCHHTCTFLKFMSRKQGSNIGTLVARFIQVKTFYIKKCTPQKPLACTSALASSYLLVVAGVTTSEDGGCAAMVL